ncbi:MAG: 50S ribosomal protein L29 [Minisyncoccia bacterium]
MNKHMKDISKKDAAELVKMLAEKREELRALRFSAAGARAQNPNAARNTRKDIARTLTALGAQGAVKASAKDA